MLRVIWLIFFVFIVWSGLARAAEATPGLQTEWERTLEAAKKEGRLVLLTVDGFSPFFQEFQKRFPEIKVVEGFSGAVAERTQILLAERRAGMYRFDISFGSPAHTEISMHVKKGIVYPITPALMLPEVIDQSAWWEGRHHYLDPEEKYFFVFEGAIRSADIAYNTNLVSAREIRSYWDLLDARWRGKIVLPDPRRVGGIVNSGLRLFYWHPDLGPNYIRRLFSEMEVTLSRDHIQMMNWLAGGKFAFYLFSRRADDAIRQGLPVNELPPSQFKEGGLLGSIRGVIALVNRAPHPNAAKLFINWVLSREGQTAFQRVSVADNPSSGNSMREDIPKDLIPMGYRRIKGTRYLVATPDKGADIAHNIAKEELERIGK